MSWSPLQLRRIAFLGPRKASVCLDFSAGLNVLCGASDTGKSFIVEAIDFLFGGSGPLRDIPERIGYDRTRMGLKTKMDEVFTFERSVEGGDFRRYQGLLNGETDVTEGVNLRARHAQGRTDTLSAWLLAEVDLGGRRVRRNQRGETQTLSFRDLARLVIVQETEITKQGSPFLSGQYVNRTAEYSVLKLLLTGVDDSSLIAAGQPSQIRENVTAKVELVDQWLADLRTQARDLGVERAEIDVQLRELEEAIDDHRSRLTGIEGEIEEALLVRRNLFREREGMNARVDEIEELLARFRLLRAHYQIDLERLSAVQESGSLFVYEKKVVCPLCGALPEAQHLDSDCDGNVEETVKAAAVERDKIGRLSTELDQTVEDLRSESQELNVQSAETERQYNAIDDEIRKKLSPNLGAVRAAFSELVEQRATLGRTADLFLRIQSLEEQRSQFAEGLSSDVQADASRTDLSKSVLEEFSEHIREILRAWHFPGAEKIYFDESTTDFVLDGKPRGSRGKGLRAITHAAISVGLMEYCSKRSLPHPGFVVLDSPLLAYWAPEGAEDAVLQGTDLKDRFYEYLASQHRDNQIVIIENEHPPDALLRGISSTVFTKNPREGRYGFFPAND